MKEPKILLNSWGGARYIDLWLLVHFLAGLSLAFGLRLLDVSFFSAFLIVGAVLVAWGFFEEFGNIAEPWTNTFLDLLIGFWAYGLPIRRIPLSVATKA